MQASEARDLCYALNIDDGENVEIILSFIEALSVVAIDAAATVQAGTDSASLSSGEPVAPAAQSSASVIAPVDASSSSSPAETAPAAPTAPEAAPAAPEAAPAAPAEAAAPVAPTAVPDVTGADVAAAPVVPQPTTTTPPSRARNRPNQSGTHPWLALVSA